MGNVREVNTENKNGNYGLLSMVAIIVGTVVGSGIFIKNQSLMNDSQSVILTSVAWIIGGIVVVCMLLAFLEVSSITKIKNEQGTFTNWSKRLYGEKTSKFIGVYFTLIYFPLVLASEGIFAGQKMTEMSMFTQFLKDDTMIYLNWAIITLIALFVVTFAFTINIVWVKPGKIFASSISVVKLIPLLVVVLGAVLVIGGLTVGDISSPNEGIFDPGSDYNTGIEGVGGSFKTILLIMPGVMFAFDGFLYANSLSTETKKPSTYKNAAIISIAIITTVYLSFSLSTFVIAQGTDFTISGILNSMFPSLHFIADILVFMIFLSITSATFGYALASQWSLADASNGGLVKDSNGEMIKRNKVGNPYKAGWFMFYVTLGSTLLFRVGDLLTILTIFESSASGTITAGTEITSWSTPMTDFISDFYTLLNFGLYSLLIFGILLNRFTNKNEVEKVKGFFVFAIIALSIVATTTVVFSIDIIVEGIIHPLIDGVDNANGIKSIYKVVMLLVLFSIYASTLAYTWNGTTKLSKEEKEYKAAMSYAYSNHVRYDEIKDLMATSKNYKEVYEFVDKGSG